MAQCLYLWDMVKKIFIFVYIEKSTNMNHEVELTPLTYRILKESKNVPAVVSVGPYSPSIL